MSISTNFRGRHISKNMIEWLLFFACYAVIGIIAVKLGGMKILLGDLLLIHDKSLSAISHVHMSVSLWFSFVCAAAITPPFFRFGIIGSYIFCSFVCKIITRTKHTGEITKMPSKSGKLHVAVIAPILEELIFRGLFLGLLPMISIFSSPVALVYLILISSTVWTLLHLPGFTREGSGAEMVFASCIILLPHFLFGLVLSCVFLKLGILACIVVHCLVNTIYVACRAIQA